MTMEENKKNLAEGDWELSEEYYHQDSSKKTLKNRTAVRRRLSERTMSLAWSFRAWQSRYVRRWSLRRRECLRRRSQSVSESRLPMCAILQSVCRHFRRIIRWQLHVCLCSVKGGCPDVFYHGNQPGREETEL